MTLVLASNKDPDARTPDLSGGQSRQTRILETQTTKGYLLLVG